MDRPTDPAHFRVGVSLGSAEDEATAVRLITTINEVMARALNLVRVFIVVLPIVFQCFYIHDVDFVPWLLRLLAIYVLLGFTAFLVVPEQLYNGMGMSALRWAFEKVYPDIALANGSISGASERTPTALMAGMHVDDLAGVPLRLRWHDTNRYLGFTRMGWAVGGDRKFAPTFVLQHVQGKDNTFVPDTYIFRVVDPHHEWNQHWLSFSPINQWRFGGWLGAFNDKKTACPYKIIQDSSCPEGTCKLLCAWSGMPLPSQRFCTGFYLAEQFWGRDPFVGHASDRDAALFEFVPASH